MIRTIKRRNNDALLDPNSQLLFSLLITPHNGYTAGNHEPSSKGNGIGLYRSCIILLLIISLVPAVTATADTMFRANPEHTGVYEDNKIVPTNTKLWRFKTGRYLDSSPAVSEGVVFVGSRDHYLYAIDAVSGTE